MEIQHDRRRWLREVLNPPEIGILYTNNQGHVPGVEEPEDRYQHVTNALKDLLVLAKSYKMESEINP